VGIVVGERLGLNVGREVKVDRGVSVEVAGGVDVGVKVCVADGDDDGGTTVGDRWITTVCVGAGFV